MLHVALNQTPCIDWPKPMTRIRHRLWESCSMWAGIEFICIALSTNSKEMLAEKSGHLIDRPDIVIDAIEQVVQSARDKTPL